MLVTGIQPYKAQDGSSRWKITFAEDGTPLILTYEPTFSIGANIPSDFKTTTPFHIPSYFDKGSGAGVSQPCSATNVVGYVEGF